MTAPLAARQRAAVRAIGGEHNAIRAEQLRAVGRGDRVIARLLDVDRDAVVRWFVLQDELATHPDLDGAA